MTKPQDISKFVHRMDCAHNVSLMRLVVEGRIDERPDPCDCKDRDGKFLENLREGYGD